MRCKTHIGYLKDKVFFWNFVSLGFLRNLSHTRTYGDFFLKGCQNCFLRLLSNALCKNLFAKPLKKIYFVDFDRRTFVSFESKKFAINVKTELYVSRRKFCGRVVFLWRLGCNIAFPTLIWTFLVSLPKLFGRLDEIAFNLAGKNNWKRKEFLWKKDSFTIFFVLWPK